MHRLIADKELSARRGSTTGLIWAGLLLGVSFVATPAKFLAPSLSRPVALDVGRHTFQVFGGIELGLATLLFLRAAASQPLLAISPGLMTVFQAFCLRPRLSKRAQAIINGHSVSGSSSLHTFYVASEIAKLAILFSLQIAAARSRNHLAPVLQKQTTMTREPEVSIERAPPRMSPHG